MIIRLTLLLDAAQELIERSSPLLSVRRSLCAACVVVFILNSLLEQLSTCSGRIAAADMEMHFACNVSRGDIWVHCTTVEQLCDGLGGGFSSTGLLGCNCSKCNEHC